MSSDVSIQLRTKMLYEENKTVNLENSRGKTYITAEDQLRHRHQLTNIAENVI